MSGFWKQQRQVKLAPRHGLYPVLLREVHKNRRSQAVFFTDDYGREKRKAEGNKEERRELRSFHSLIYGHLFLTNFARSTLGRKKSKWSCAFFPRTARFSLGRKRSERSNNCSPLLLPFVKHEYDLAQQIRSFTR